MRTIQISVSLNPHDETILKHIHKESRGMGACVTTFPNSLSLEELSATLRRLRRAGLAREIDDGHYLTTIGQDVAKLLE